MAVEAARGCGYRKVGGLYLVGGGAGMSCDRMPYELVTCPVCGSGIKFTRGFQWVDWAKYAGEHASEETEHLISAKSQCSCFIGCPVCYPTDEPQPYGLLWVGESFYTPENFIAEALKMGISRRIAAVPRRLKLGETWVLFAHKSACGTRQNEEGKTEGIPGIFYAFRPKRIELLIWQRDARDEYLEDLERRGITPIIIPDGDLDHDPKTPLRPDEDAIRTAENERFFGGLRDKLAGLKDLEDEDTDQEE